MMDAGRVTRIDATAWRIEPNRAMPVPAVIHANQALISDMDAKGYKQSANIAALPGIERARHMMPDAHWGRYVSIGGVAADAPDACQDVTAVVTATEQAGLALPVAHVPPRICAKG